MAKEFARAPRARRAPPWLSVVANRVTRAASRDSCGSTSQRRASKRSPNAARLTLPATPPLSQDASTIPTKCPDTLAPGLIPHPAITPQQATYTASTACAFLMDEVVQEEAFAPRPGPLPPSIIADYDSDPTAPEGDGSDGGGAPPPLPGHQLSQLVAPLESRCDSEAPEGSDAAGSASDDASSSSDSEAGLLKRVPAMRVGSSYQAVLPPETEQGGPSEAERPSPDELVWRPDDDGDDGDADDGLGIVDGVDALLGAARAELDEPRLRGARPDGARCVACA